MKGEVAGAKKGLFEMQPTGMQSAGNAPNYPAVELSAVCQRYRKGAPVLKQVDAVIKQGEFVSVIGPSGAGKTTLLRVLNGAVPVCGGSVMLFGERFDTLKGGRKRRMQRKIGTIYQDFCLVDGSACLDNVLNGALAQMPFWRALTGCFQPSVEKQALEALEAVGLRNMAETKAGHLSGGQKQRTAIARAFMQNPELILADEPVASLDPASGKQVLELLKQLQRQRGITVIMNSHSLSAALEYSDRILGMKAGEIVFDLPPSQVDEGRLKQLYGREGEQS